MRTAIAVLYAWLVSISTVLAVAACKSDIDLQHLPQVQGSSEHVKQRVQ